MQQMLTLFPVTAYLPIIIAVHILAKGGFAAAVDTSSVLYADSRWVYHTYAYSSAHKREYCRYLAEDDKALERLFEAIQGLPAAKRESAKESVPAACRETKGIRHESDLYVPAYPAAKREPISTAPCFADDAGKDRRLFMRF